MQDPSIALRRIHDTIDGKASGPIYKGASSGELSVRNNQAFFPDKVVKVLGIADRGIWTLTPDRRHIIAGLPHLHPELVIMSSLQRELFQEIIGDQLGTHDELTPTELVEVPAIDGSFVQIRAQDASVTEWLRKLMRENCYSRVPERPGLNNTAVREAEAWKAASRRLGLGCRAYIADPIRPHSSKAIFCCRYITEQQLIDLLEHLVQLLLPSAFDNSGL